MNTCDTCKWWKPEERSPNVNPIPDCGFVHGKCTHPKIDYTRREPDPWIESSDGATQWGMDAGYVDFAPGPKFGCVQWQSK